MRKYRSNASSTVRLRLGVEVATGLRAFSETVHAAEEFEPVQAGLKERLAARLETETPLLEARAGLRITNFLFDKTSRLFVRSAESADGGRRGPVYAELFPDGFTRFVALTSARQVEAADALLGRLAASKLPAAEPLRKEWQARLQASTDALRTAVTAHVDARKAWNDAFVLELAQRDEHERAIERIMGELRRIYPGDREMQNVFFPDSVSTGAATSEDQDGLEEVAATEELIA